MNKNNGLIIILTFLLSAVNVSAEETRFVIDLTNQGDFDVFFHRSQSTAAPAVLAGLVGAGIATGVNKSKDTNLENDLIEKTGEIVCHKNLIKAFKKKLKSKDHFSIIDGSSASTDDNHQTIELNIKDCGYKLANQDNEMLSAFVFFKVKIKPTKLSKINLDESFMIKLSQHHPLNELMQNSEIVSSEMTKVLEKAGKRLANKIIYYK